jgi:hypothetical protein
MIFTLKMFVKTFLNTILEPCSPFSDNAAQSSFFKGFIHLITTDTFFIEHKITYGTGILSMLCGEIVTALFAS